LSQPIAQCYNNGNRKVTAGVVGRPASEMGEQGGSPSRRKRERQA
jgi:hypothetical protein